MSTATYDLPIDNAEGYNTVRTLDGWKARENFLVLNKVAVDVLYGFSVTSINGSQYFYEFSISGVKQQVVVATLLDSQYTVIGTSELGYLIDRSAPITHAINCGQIIINSPGWSTPAWCYIGSTPIPAVKVESANPDTPAIDLFVGQVCSFADRFVWAYANQIIVNDPGTEPRTLTSPNVIPFTGDICDIFQQGGNGNLVVVTTDSVYTLPPDGFSGFQYSGQISKSTHYRGLNPRNAASARGQVHGLTRDGLMNLETGEIMALTKYRHPRRITAPVGPGAGGDYRSGSIFVWEAGYVISFGQGRPFCCVDLDTNSISWWEDSLHQAQVKAVASDNDGRMTLYLYDSVVVLWGDNMQDAGGIAAEIPIAGIASNVVREITVTATGDGTSEVSSYVRGSLQSSVVPGPPGGVVANTSRWGASTTLIECEYRSRRHQRAVRTDGIAFEVGISADQVLQNAQIKTVTQSPGRSTF